MKKIKLNFLFFIITMGIIVYFIPKNVALFNYKYSKGKPWVYENLYTPFDFLIKKNPEEIEREKKEINNNKRLYYRYDFQIKNDVFKDFESEIDNNFTSIEREKIINILQHLYTYGIVKEISKDATNSNFLISILKGNEELEPTASVFDMENALKYCIKESDKIYGDDTYKSNKLNNIFFKIIKPNLTFDQELTNKILGEEINKIVVSKGKVIKGSKIVEKGQIIDENIFDNLYSIEEEYANKGISGIKYYLVILGYSIIISSVLGVLFIFLIFYKYRDTFISTKKVLIILSSILLLFFMSLFFSSIEYNGINMIYILPICMIPILIRTFFDYKMSLFIHVIALLIISISLKNSFDFFYTNILAGFVSILGVKEIHKRANLFINVGKITLSYCISYYCILLIQNGSISYKDLNYILIFMLNGVLTLFSLPLIYAYEKIFGIVSDISLLELLDTNSNILRKLSTKAPGTFQHSLQVANMSENVARNINGNGLLVRVGALYHDIGKLKAPEYFTENQYTKSPHDSITPKESAKIIIDHVAEGLKMSDRYNLPKIIKNFISTHHGTSLVYFFYKKDVDIHGEENVNIDDYRYPGPIPYSKEMAILMMCDSIEAASKSLDNPTEEDFKKLVEKIVDSQIKNNQFRDTDITFKEIEIAKRTIVSNLKSIYKNRIKYPD